VAVLVKKFYSVRIIIVNKLRLSQIDVCVSNGPPPHFFFALSPWSISTFFHDTQKFLLASWQKWCRFCSYACYFSDDFSNDNLFNV